MFIKLATGYFLLMLKTACLRPAFCCLGWGPQGLVTPVKATRVGDFEYKNF